MADASLRVLVLAYVEAEGAHDVDVVGPQVLDALVAAGHNASSLWIHSDINVLLGAVREQRPDVIFNLLEMFGDDWFADIAAAGLVELLGVPFTGGGAREFALAQDKSVGKALLRQEGLATARYVHLRRGCPRERAMELFAGRLARTSRFIVKPCRMDSSLGIDEAACVDTPEQAFARAEHIHAHWGDDALVEEFLAGDEYFVGVLEKGDGAYEGLAPVVVKYNLPPGVAPILSRAAKFETESAAYAGTETLVADIAPGLRAQLVDVAQKAATVFRVRDYGRVDLRLDAAGEPHVIEVNPSCYLERDSEFAMAARASGWTYEGLVEHIARNAIARYRMRFNGPTPDSVR